MHIRGSLHAHEELGYSPSEEDDRDVSPDWKKKAKVTVARSAVRSALAVHCVLRWYTISKWKHVEWDSKMYGNNSSVHDRSEKCVQLLGSRVVPLRAVTTTTAAAAAREQQAAVAQRNEGRGGGQPLQEERVRIMPPVSVVTV